MKIEITRAIGDIVAELEETISVLETLNIDYGVGGNRTLKDACYLAGVPVERVVSMIEKASLDSTFAPAAKDWRYEPLENVIDHILERHHAYTWHQINALRNVMDKAVQESSDDGLEELDNLIQQVFREIEKHMTKEEEVIFPYIRKAVRAKESGEPIPRDLNNFFPEKNPLQILMWEHGMVGNDWKQIKALTNYYQAPANATEELRVLYRGLMALEFDIHQHTHLETSVLFRRAIEMGLLD